MPKEVIRGGPGSAVPVVQEGAPGSDDQLIAVNEAVVEVRWNREAEHVQVVTRELNHAMHGSEDSPIPCEYGYYWTPDRRAINDLIRTLRRARDAAFGRDE